MQIILQNMMCDLIAKKALIFSTYAEWWFGSYAEGKIDNLPLNT